MTDTIIPAQASIELEIIDGEVHLRQHNPMEGSDVIVIAASNIGRLIDALGKVRADIEKGA